MFPAFRLLSIPPYLGLIPKKDGTFCVLPLT